MAQVESEPFKVTTKKGYDGCRKAEYLNAREVRRFLVFGAVLLACSLFFGAWDLQAGPALAVGAAGFVLFRQQNQLTTL